MRTPDIAEPVIGRAFARPVGSSGLRLVRDSREGRRIPRRLSPDRLQSRFDGRAARLQERRQREFFAERFHRLVGGKAGPVGRDLEQDAVGLAKIQALEIKPVDLTAVGNTEVAQASGPGVLLCLIGGAKRPMMHAPGALSRYRRILLLG